MSILGDFLYCNKIANKKHKNTFLMAQKDGHIQTLSTIYFLIFFDESFRLQKCSFQRPLYFIILLNTYLLVTCYQHQYLIYFLSFLCRRISTNQEFLICEIKIYKILISTRYFLYFATTLTCTS